jgi:hypothetical protein
MVQDASDAIARNLLESVPVPDSDQKADNQTTPVVLTHMRTGCTAQGRLIKAYRLQIVTNTSLRRYHLTKKANKKGYRHKEYLCGTCARTKITRRSFKKRESIIYTRFLEKVTCDISVYLNCPSREGRKYMLVFTDAATKMIWSYGLHERTADDVLVSLKDLYEKELPPEATFENFHPMVGEN